jgi:hypothetical protein
MHFLRRLVNFIILGKLHHHYCGDHASATYLPQFSPAGVGQENCGKLGVIAIQPCNSTQIELMSRLKI